MRKFDINKLPADVLEKVAAIEFYEKWEQEETGNQGLCFLDDGWVLDYDGSHTFGFTSRKDLINEVRNFTQEADSDVIYDI